jgi:hypothetical protein
MNHLEFILNNNKINLFINKNYFFELKLFIIIYDKFIKD